MWLSVDRIEGSFVVLVADDEQIYHLDVSAYESLTGLSPQEAHMLWVEARDGTILSARYDPEETTRRKQAAQDRLNRLLRKNKT